MKSLSVRDLFIHKQEELSAALRAVRSVTPHEGEKGTASELKWIEMLKHFLPKRYKVSKGFVLSCDGDVSKQIDVIIHDSHYSPLLFDTDSSRFVPAESVYAVFDSKQTLNRRTVEQAAEKAKSVRQLRRTKGLIHYLGNTVVGEPKEILAGVLAVKSDWNPAFGEPFTRLMSSFDREESLQIGCAVDSGAFETNRDWGDKTIVHVSPAEVALVSFCLGLLGLLQMMGTVAAMDLVEWSKPLFSTESS